MFPEVQTEYPALSGRKNAISFRKLVESSGLYEKRSLCPDFIATFVAGLVWVIVVTDPGSREDYYEPGTSFLDIAPASAGAFF